MKILLIFALMFIALWVVLEVWSVFQNKENSNIEFLNKEHIDILKGYSCDGLCWFMFKNTVFYDDFSSR